MKIIQVDNFGRDNISDKLIAENVNEYYGRFMVDKLNEKYNRVCPDKYYKLVEDDYELYKFDWEE